MCECRVWSERGGAVVFAGSAAHLLHHQYRLLILRFLHPLARHRLAQLAVDELIAHGHVHIDVGLLRLRAGRRALLARFHNLAVDVR